MWEWGGQAEVEWGGVDVRDALHHKDMTNMGLLCDEDAPARGIKLARLRMVRMTHGENEQGGVRRNGRREEGSGIDAEEGTEGGEGARARLDEDDDGAGTVGVFGRVVSLDDQGEGIIVVMYAVVVKQDVAAHDDVDGIRLAGTVRRQRPSWHGIMT